MIKEVAYISFLSILLYFGVLFTTAGYIEDVPVISGVGVIMLTVWCGFIIDSAGKKNGS